MAGMRKHLLSASALVWALLLAVLLPQPCALAQNPQLTKRLILKDGSYQPATKWEIHGDRVRYYSAERYEWEEVPYSMVDWPATEKWEKESASHRVSEETKAVSEELEEARRAEDARTPLVAPGVKLPSQGGVFLLDKFQGQPQLVELTQSGGEVKKNMGKNVLRAAINPLASMKQRIELAGTRARVQSHETRPIIYVNVDTDFDSSTGSTPPDAAHRFRLLRLQRKKDSRVVGNLKIALTGKVSQQESFIETVAEPFSGDWVRVTPAKDLAPGEYALAEMLGEKQINLYVWDFGVDPSAPANRGAWKPVSPPPSKTGTDESPVLGTRTK
jgi:hypothetical protein